MVLCIVPEIKMSDARIAMVVLCTKSERILSRSLGFFNLYHLRLLNEKEMLITLNVTLAHDANFIKIVWGLPIDFFYEAFVGALFAKHL